MKITLEDWFDNVLIYFQSDLKRNLQCNLEGKCRVLQGNLCNKNRFFPVRIDLQEVPSKPYRVWVCSVLRVPCKPSRVWVCSVCRNLTKSFCKYEVDLFISADILSIIFHPYLKFEQNWVISEFQESHLFKLFFSWNSFWLCVLSWTLRNAWEV